MGGYDSGSIRLHGGPHDGVLAMIGDATVIFVVRAWRGDGYVAWAREASERFPFRYAKHGLQCCYEPLERT